MKQVLNYNIHNLEIRLERNKGFDIINNYDVELSLFRVNTTINPDIFYKIGEFKPSNEGCYVVDNKYHVKENYFYCKDSFNGMEWELEIFGFNQGKVVANYNYKMSGISKYISKFNFDTLFLRPLIFFKLKEKGKIMIHGGGVSKNGKAYIFPGRGGAYKTSLIMNLLKEDNYSYIGDDWIVLDNSKALAFPAHFSFFNYTFKEKRDEFINIFDKVKYLLYLSKYKENDNIKISDPCNLSLIIFMNKTSKNHEISIKKLDFNNAIDKLIQNIKMEFMYISIPIIGFSLTHFHEYILAYSYIFPDSEIANYWENLKIDLKNNLDNNIDIYEIEVPKNYNSEILEKILEIIGE